MSKKVEEIAKNIEKLSDGGQMLVKMLLSMMSADDRYEYKIGHDSSDHGEMYLLMKYDKKTKQMTIIDEVWKPKK